METKQGFTVKTVKPFFYGKKYLLIYFLQNVCSSDVAVAYDLAKVGERVRLPSIALFKSARLPSSIRSRPKFLE